jgi:hypothetical protein
MSIIGHNSFSGRLADMTLQLEPGPCSKAPTERAIGNARRMEMDAASDENEDRPGQENLSIRFAFVENGRFDNDMTI